MLRPDADANAEIDKNLPRWRREFNLGGRAMAPERRHVSLLAVGHTGRLPEGHADRVCRKVARFSASPFEVRFDGIARFGGNSVVLLGSQENRPAGELQQMLADFLKNDVPPPPSDYVAHITLLHDNYAPRHLHPIDPIGWMATEFFPVESFQGAGRHDVCGRWDLHRVCRQACEPGDGMRSGELHGASGLLEAKTPIDSRRGA